MLFALCQCNQLNDLNELNDPNLLTFVIFYLKKFLLACGTIRHTTQADKKALLIFQSVKLIFLLKRCDHCLHKIRQIIRLAAGDEIAVYDHGFVHPQGASMNHIIFDRKE
jgi:hypothetical protein